MPVRHSSGISPGSSVHDTKKGFHSGHLHNPMKKQAISGDELLPASGNTGQPAPLPDNEKPETGSTHEPCRKKHRPSEKCVHPSGQDSMPAPCAPCRNGTDGISRQTPCIVIQPFLCNAEDCGNTHMKLPMEKSMTGSVRANVPKPYGWLEADYGTGATLPLRYR